MVGAHAEGHGTTAAIEGAHSEGGYTQALAQFSHAEGKYTISRHPNSHAEGNYTQTTGANQHVQGSFNDITDTTSYAHIVGGGTSENNRRNIHTLDWEGNAWFAGDITFKYNGKTYNLGQVLESLANIIEESAEETETDTVLE